MSQIHQNSLYFNYGIHLLGQAPIDDRTVWSSFEDIYVDGDDPTAAPMYNKVHTGMQVAIVEVDSLGNPNATLLVLKDDSPYTPGADKTVDADNYNYYWSVLGSDIYEKIEDATYFHNESTDPSTMKMLDKHGNLDEGTTLADLEKMTISAILKAILFEVAIATLKNNMSARCSWNNYSTLQEVGSAMPTVSNISYSFTPEVWHCVTSAGKEYATYDLNVLDEDDTKKYYTQNTSTNTGGTDMSTTAYTGIYNYVDEGTHYFYVDVAYTEGVDAYDTNDNLRTEAYSGNIQTTPISFTGAYRIFSNAWATYTSASTAYANRGDETTAWDETAKKYSSLMNGTVTLYFKWPSDITTGQEFHIYVPVGYEISEIKAANNTSKDTYDLDATATKQTDTVTISTTNGQATGEYIDYIVTRASGNTNVMVVFQ